MNFEEAQQIFNSTETIDVLHKGKSVWINDLNPRDKTANVSAAGQSYLVSVQELIRG